MIDWHVTPPNGWEAVLQDGRRLGLSAALIVVTLWMSMMLSIAERVSYRPLGLSSVTIWDSIGHHD